MAGANKPGTTGVSPDPHHIDTGTIALTKHHPPGIPQNVRATVQPNGPKYQPLNLPSTLFKPGHVLVGIRHDREPVPMPLAASFAKSFYWSFLVFATSPSDYEVYRFYLKTGPMGWWFKTITTVRSYSIPIKGSEIRSSIELPNIHTLHNWSVGIRLDRLAESSNLYSCHFVLTPPGKQGKYQSYIFNTSDVSGNVNYEDRYFALSDSKHWRLDIDGTMKHYREYGNYKRSSRTIARQVLTSRTKQK